MNSKSDPAATSEKAKADVECFIRVSKVVLKLCQGIFSTVCSSYENINRIRLAASIDKRNLIIEYLKGGNLNYINSILTNFLNGSGLTGETQKNVDQINYTSISQALKRIQIYCNEFLTATDKTGSYYF